MRGVTAVPLSKEREPLFQLTRLMRGVTGSACSVPSMCTISTHTPHARRDRKCKGGSKAIAISTHTPHARRDDISSAKTATLSLISTHTPHARRDLIIIQWRCAAMPISTHTPHARRDPLTYFSIHEPHISTHTPHARRDRLAGHSYRWNGNFNSHASCEA